MPVYLRASGTVQNLCLSRREISQLIDESLAFVKAAREKERATEAKHTLQKALARQAAIMDPLVVAMTSLLDDTATTAFFFFDKN